MKKFNLEEMFDQLDTDGNQELDVDELRQMLVNLVESGDLLEFTNEQYMYLWGCISKTDTDCVTHASFVEINKLRYASNTSFVC